MLGNEADVDSKGYTQATQAKASACIHAFSRIESHFIIRLHGDRH